ncbi:MAG: hypothetical protein KDC53_08540 [Saprospiraceae bacterium]|nr:hypothetical protein [Saprospiraceae bacterium]
MVPFIVPGSQIAPSSSKTDGEPVFTRLSKSYTVSRLLFSLSPTIDVGTAMTKS